MPEPDLLDDARELMAKQGVAPATVTAIIAALRRRWGGDAPYIRVHDRARIDATIRHGLKAGEPVADIARKAGVSERTVRRRASRLF